MLPNIKNIKRGDKLIADGGFTCLKPGAKRTVFIDGGKPYICCDHGHHFLDGQMDAEGYLVGLSYVSNTNSAAA